MDLREHIYHFVRVLKVNDSKETVFDLELVPADLRDRIPKTALRAKLENKHTEHGKKNARHGEMC